MAEGHHHTNASSSTDKSSEFSPIVDESLLEPWRYIHNIPGKNVRGMMIDAFQVWLNVSDPPLSTIKDIVATLHDASLLVDDIEDNSEMRRGVPVAHAIYGLPMTINCANYVYFIALQKAHDLNNSKALSVFVNEMLILHKGQGYDILWRETSTCPTEEQYKQMALSKTGGLFRLSVGMMQAFSTCTLDFTSLVNHMALYFQIRDDYINLVSAKYMEHKSFCEDLTEGKFSYPIIYAILSDPSDNRLQRILSTRTSNVDIKKHALHYIEKTGALDYTLCEINRLYSVIQTEINALGGNDLLMALVTKLHNMMDERDSVVLSKKKAEYL